MSLLAHAVNDTLAIVCQAMPMIAIALIGMELFCPGKKIRLRLTISSI
jgi:hypothetical protein